MPRARLSSRDLALELWVRVVGVDRSVLSLVRGLITRPGGVSRDWVEGRRRRYYAPLNFLMWMLGLSVAAIVATHFRLFTAPDGGDSPASRFLFRYVNIVQLLQVPLLAAWGVLLFGRSRRNYAEQLVLGAYASSMRMGVGSLLLLVVSIVGTNEKPYPLVARTFLVLWVAYFAWASSQFHDGRRWVVALKGAAVAVLTHLTTNLVIARAFGVTFALDPSA